MQISQKIGQYEVLKTYGKDAAIVTDTMNLQSHHQMDLKKM